MNSDNIMKFESMLPEDFDGVFRFTNPSKEDFIGKWGGKEYLFPAESTVPMIIAEHSPLEIQHIRKKFAKDLAEREFYKSREYAALKKQEGPFGNPTFNSIKQAAAYTESDLVPYIQKCLIPLAPAQILSRPAEPVVDVESKLKKADDGTPVTEVVAGGQNWQQSKASLKQRALNA